MTLPPWTDERAHFSGPHHRVWLRRRINMLGSFPACFILHNPSIAGRDNDDPTSRRGIAFATAWGASDLIYVNAATGCATNADDLANMDDPIGPMADEALQVAAEFCRQHGGIMVAAWGAPKGKAKTKRLMAERFDAIKALGLPLHYLRLTASGHPEHPLYLPGSLRPMRWEYSRQALKEDKRND